MKTGYLHKPNPIVTGIGHMDSTEYKYMNFILQQYFIQNPYENNKDYVSISLEKFKNLSSNKTLHNIKGILSFIENNLQKEIIKWTWNYNFYCFNILSGTKYNQLENKIYIYIPTPIIEFINEYYLEETKKTSLYQGYTPINLDLTNNCKSSYTGRLYELLRRWSATKKEVIISINELKDMFLLKDIPSYNQFKELNRNVLAPALKEINSKMNMNVNMEKIKSGNKVIALKFIINDKEPRNYNIKKKVKYNNYEISSEEYVTLTDLKLNVSIHKEFVNTYTEYNKYIHIIENAVAATLSNVGGKTINKHNYKYFTKTLESKLPSIY